MKKTNSTKNVMHQWFIYLFEERMDNRGYVKCFECGKPLHESYYKETSTCYSHLLSKKKYPQYKGDPDNLVICCPDCHHLFGMHPSRATNQWNAQQLLIQKYEL
jgi:5-methylcytosine-specific restriction endonuclease McrA